MQGGAEMIGGEVQIFQRDGGSRATAGGGGVVDDGVIVRSVDQSVRPQPDSRDNILFVFILICVISLVLGAEVFSTSVLNLFVISVDKGLSQNIHFT